MDKERIGFVGLGLMGRGMAKNIVTKGFPLTVLGHRNRAPVEELVALGASEAKIRARPRRSLRHRRALRHRQPGGRSDRRRPRRTCLGRQAAADHRLLDLRSVLDDQARGDLRDRASR